MKRWKVEDFCGWTRVIIVEKGEEMRGNAGKAQKKAKKVIESG